MKVRARPHIRLGPITLNMTERGFSSWSIKIGRYTWNSRTHKSHVDTPGPGSIEFGGKNNKH